MYPIKKKSDVFSVFKEYTAQVELESGKKIKCLRTDNGGKYTDDEFLAFCKQEGEYSEAVHGSIHSLTKWSGRADE